MARCPTCHRRLVSGQRCVEHGHANVVPVSRSTDAPPSWAQPLGACLGSGGFAAVWEIVGARGVLKLAHAAHDLARARMRREAEALGAIGAPAVPALLGEGILLDGRPWLAMSRVAGDNLADVIAGGTLRGHAVIAVAAQILDALAQIHAAGFAHRDLKPDNIVRCPDSVVILDLGLARRLPDDADDPNRAGVQVGSVEYMAPEQLLDASAAGTAADLYAFGCILYELCAGRPPFVGDATALERAHAALRPPPLGALAEVPRALEQLVHDCLAKQPARRPASAAEVAARLRDVAHETPPARAQHSMSMIREGTQPVVLLWAELPRVDRTLLAALAARKIAIASQRGRRLLGGVVGAEHADPARAAIAAARDLAAAGARVALHLDALTVTPAATGVTLAGASITAPESWLPPGPWTGVVMTRALAAVAQVPARASEYAGFAVLGEPGSVTVELVGRDALLDELVRDAAAAFAGGPGLAVLVGDAGIGKSAIGTAVAARLAGVRVCTGSVPPPGSGTPGHAVLSALVGDPPAGSVVRAIGDALRAAARERPTAVILDDVHLAEHDLLDALEYATLGGELVPLWVLAIASPRLDQRRPTFGNRAERHRRDVVPPLDDDAAVALTAALLRPAEYPPLRALRQIAAIARGNPMHLTTLARDIHDRGAIRTRPNGEHFLDTTALDALLAAGGTGIALGPWLAARELAHLGDELVALARVCAVLGEDLDHDELAAVMRAVEQRGGATTTIDVDVGLAELVAHSILHVTGERWTFRHALLAEGIYTTTNDAERRAIHVAALEYWARHGDPARIARHAEAVGQRHIAAAAFATVGARAHAAHRSLDADQAWQGAVRNLGEHDLARGRALLGRARARYRLQRVRDALADLDAALAIAEACGDRILAIEALLEQATALDWSDDYAGSAAATAQARARWEAAPIDCARAARAIAELAPEIALASARVVYREGRHAEAAPLLEAVIDDARAADHVETAVIAGILLAPTLIEIGELERAETVFARSIAQCEQIDDRLHLGAAYANRTVLWAARGDVARVAEDLRFVIRLAREIGQAVLERIVSYNLAEDLMWAGELDEALRLARRSLALQLGHGEGSVWPDQLLLARIHATRGERAELAALVDELAKVELAPADLATVAVLRCAVDRAVRAEWERVLAIAVPLVGDKQARELSRLAERTW